jgi:AcrR family transcriptional regulator
MSIQIKISEKLFLKDPNGTVLGQRIVINSIELIDSMGFEQFTFKKLAAHISSTEASIYRYFENKHKLLIYLTSWYWSWLSFRLKTETHRVVDGKEKISIAVRIFCHLIPPISMPEGIDLNALHNLLISESSKAYLTKEVDNDNKEGAFLSYKRFCKEVAAMIKEVNPKYPNPTALISTCVEAAHHQKFFSDHLPSLTEVSKGNMEEVAAFLEDMIFRVIDGQ